jgi:hypothetical protein
MHAPDWVTEELFNVHKQARLAWLGVPSDDDEAEGEEKELNRGTFVLLQLYHKRDVANISTVTPWEEFPCKGPIFGRRFDPISRKPVVLAYITPQDVFSGKVIKMVKDWCKPMKQRYAETAQAKGKQLNETLDDQVGEAADYMMWKANQGYDKPNIVARKHISKRDQAILSGDVDNDVSDMFMPEKGRGVY